jgi:hypothetical protein
VGIDINPNGATEELMAGADFDTGAGTDYRLGVGLVAPASGGAAVIPGDATDGLKAQVKVLGGPVAADGALAANPVTVGARGSTATPAAMSTDGDVTNLWCDLNGRLHTTPDTWAGQPAITPGVNGGVAVGGLVAADAAAAGNPILNGGRASTALPSAMSADGDLVSMWADRHGVQITRPINSMNSWAAFHDIASGDAVHTDQALQAAPGANLYLYITDIIIVNDSTAAMTFKIEMDTASAKTQLIGNLKIPASGGITSHFQTPIKMPTANTNIGFTNTGQSNASITILGFTAY